MISKLVTALALVTCILLSGIAMAQDDHDHSHDHSGGVDFTSLDDGWAALEEVLAEIRTAVSNNNMSALHDLST